jgi:septal ring factor EnvC (AmiA/AmiB activator)
MATNTERIDELERLVAQLKTQVQLLEQSQKWAEEQIRDLTKARDELRAADDQVRNRATVLEQQVETLRSASDLWSTRVWQLGILLLTALTSGLVGYLLKR